MNVATNLGAAPAASLPRLLDPASTLSVRMLWPFARYLGDYASELSILQEYGGDPSTFADPDARVSHATARRMVIASLEKSGDMCLGLHAGESVELADFGVPDQLTRHCATLRESISLNSRYARLHDESLSVTLTEEEHTATVHLRNENPNRFWLVNEYQVASTVTRLGMYTHGSFAPLEVHFTHDQASDPAEYARVFKCRVRLGAACNAVVMRRDFLDFPAFHPNPNLVSVFEQRATRALEQLGRAGSFTDKVRQVVRADLERGVTITESASRLYVSEATLRRRLADEGTTYKAVLDGVRHELALAHLEARREPSDVAFLLGYANFSAFARAFRRWTGASPSAYAGRAG